MMNTRLPPPVQVATDCAEAVRFIEDDGIRQVLENAHATLRKLMTENYRCRRAFESVELQFESYRKAHPSKRTV